MATRERRLAEFDGSGEPPPDQPVQVLCEDHSGTYQLPFACRFVDGEGGRVAPARDQRSRPVLNPVAVPLCNGKRANFKLWNAVGTNRARISGSGLYSLVHG